MNMHQRGFLMLMTAGLLVGQSARAEPVESEASAPQSTELAIYDQGFGVASEMRRLTPADGENLIRFRRLPLRLDPATVSFVPVAGSPGFEVLEQQFMHDSASPDLLLTRYLGREVEVVADGERHAGRLLHAPHSEEVAEGEGALLLETEDGEARVFINMDRVQQIILPDARTHVQLEPVLQWRAAADEEGPQNIRLTYRVDDIRWEAAYEVMLAEDGQRAYFAARIGLDNRTGGDYQDANIQLISTERGLLRERRRSAVEIPRDRQPGAAALRYTYGVQEPVFEEAAATLAPIHSYRLEQPVTLLDGDHKFVQYARVDALPVTRFYVYDGVRFDRFQRHRRNDWNFGTESHSVVETHLQFENERAEGLGVDLPTGRFRLYQRRADDSVEFLGEDMLMPTSAGESGHVLLGPARGLRGERERTSYTEVTPLRVYEESFQIRLENNTDEVAEIRVVEHLYRWHEFEIVRADAEYEQTADQTIEFRPTLQPGGRRTIHYTVRYSW